MNQRREMELDDGGPESTSSDGGDNEALSRASPGGRRLYNQQRMDPYHPPIPGSGGGRGFYDRHSAIPSNVEIRARDPATGAPIVVETMGPQASPNPMNFERRYYPSGYLGQEYTGVRVTPREEATPSVPTMGAPSPGGPNAMNPRQVAPVMSQEALHHYLLLA